MAFNLFSAITSGMNAYNALSGTQTGQSLIGQAKQAIAPVTQPIQQAFQPAYETAKSAVAPVTSAVGSIAKPIVKSAVFQKKTADYYAPFKSEIEKIGITYDDLAELPEEEKQQVVSQLKQIGVTIPGLVEAEQAVQQQQAVQPIEESMTDKFKMESSENFGVVEGVKDIGKFFINLPADSAEVLTGLYDVVSNPIDTATGIVKTVGGVSDKAVFALANNISSYFGGSTVGPTENAQMVDAIAKNLKDQYGTVGKFKKAVVENPADTLLTLMGGLGVAKNVAQSKGFIDIANKIDKVQKVVNPVNILKQEAKLVTAPVGFAGTAIKKAGESLYKTAIKPNVSEAEKILKFKAGLGEKPTTVADTALEKGIAGTETRIGVQALKKADEIFKKEVNPILEKSTTEHDLPTLFKKAEERINNMNEGELRKSELKEGLQALQEEYTAIGKNKFSTKTLQQEKSSLDKFTPDKLFKGKPIASSYNEAKNILANVFRNEVHADLGKFGLKSQEAFRDYANLKELSKVGIKGLTDSGFKGGFGGFWTTMYEQATTPIKTIGGQVLYKVGDKLEFVGPKGINKLGDYLKDKLSIDKNGILTTKSGTNGNNTINSNNKDISGTIKSVVKKPIVKPTKKIIKPNK